MIISTEIGSVAARIGEEAAIAAVAAAGFDAFDYTLDEVARYDWNTRTLAESGHPFRSDEYLAYAKRMRAFAEQHGIVCNQTHAPAPSHFPEIRPHLARAVEITAALGAKVCVIHPDYADMADNITLFKELAPLAEKLGVKIALENMWGWDNAANHALPGSCSTPKNMMAHFHGIDHPSVTVCLDIGHAEMRGVGTTAVEIIRAIGPQLGALHVHDNDQHNDSHAIPFSMNIDFEAVAKALKEVGYTGDLTLETVVHCRDCPVEDIPQKLAELAAAARKLAAMIEQN